MPFVSQSLRSSTGPQPPFVGRAAERRFFHQEILTPDEPTAHLLNVWGASGCGVSTLLAQWREDARGAPFQEDCLIAAADGRIGSPLQVMRTFAAQLRAAGAPLVAFEQMLAHLASAAPRPSTPEQQAALMLLTRQVQELARAHPVQGLPVLGGIYESVSETTRRDVLHQHPALALHEGQTFAEHLAALTRAFLDDLNWLATTPVASAPGRGLRVLLFLDELSESATTLLEWVRTQVLPASLSTGVVFLLGSSFSLEHVLPAEPALTSLPLHPFTRDETREFVAAWGISDPARLTRLFERTGGLPLALRLLAPVPPSWLDADEAALAPGLRWLEQQAPGYQYLVRYAALFSRSFDHQDLTVCPMFSASELILWYRRLLALPFVTHDPLTGESWYHPLVQQELRQRFASDAPAAYRQARQVIAQYYQRHVESHTRRQEPPAMCPAAEQKRFLALLEQWLWLADEPSLMQAIRSTLEFAERTEDQSALLTLLRGFAHASSAEAVPARSRQVAALLLSYREAEIHTPAFLETTGELVASLERMPGIPAQVLARVLSRRAAAWLLQDSPSQAREDSLRATSLDPMYAEGALVQGMTCAALGKQEEALEAYARTLQLAPRQVFALAHRALLYQARKAYELALEESTRVVSLAPDLPEAARLRTLIYADREKRRQGLGPFEARLARDPTDSEAYLLQGMAHCALGQHEQALASFAQAQALDPSNPRVYAGRGHVHLEGGDLLQARSDLAKAWELDPSDGTAGLLFAWVQLCLEEPETQVSALLETLVARFPASGISLLCQGIRHLLQQQFVEALAVLEQAQRLQPRQGEAAFWKGLACVYLEQDAEALEALEQARTAELPLPAVLFTPVRRIAAERPVFFQEHLQPLLQAISQTSPAQEP